MIAIVTDSSACLYKAEADRLGVTVVPMSYSLPGQPSYNENYMTPAAISRWSSRAT